MDISPFEYFFVQLVWVNSKYVNVSENTFIHNSEQVFY